MNFYTSKNLSGVGALLVFVSFIALPFAPFFGGGLLALIGLILLLIGVKGLADYYKDARIFNNMLYGTLVEIVGVVVAVAVAIVMVLSALTNFLYKIFPGWDGNWVTLSGMTPVTSNIGLGDILPFIAAALSVFVIMFVVSLLEAIFYRRSLSALKERSGVGLFGTTGLIWLIGAILTIILIGYLIIWIAILLLAIAFFELRPQPAQSMPSAGQAAVPPQTSA